MRDKDYIMLQEITIENKKISTTSPVFIIAEAGVNHNGDLAIAKQLVDAAVVAGVDAVKFQTFTDEKLVSKEADQDEYQLKNTGIKEKQFDMIKRLALDPANPSDLKEYCN